MSISPLTFSGVSSYSQDFQTILNRAVNIASLPVNQLQHEDSSVLSRKSLYGPLQQAVGSLASALTALADVADKGAASATSLDGAVVSAGASGSPAAGTYTISEISSLAAAASETSLAGYADPDKTEVSSTGTMRLTVGTKSYDLTLATNSLNGLASAINASNAGVTASVFTANGSSYLNVTAQSTGAAALAITDDPGDAGHANAAWLTATNQGSNATFKLNGITVTRSSNTITDVVAGVEIGLKAKTSAGQTVQISVATDRALLASALSTLAARYNAAVDEVAKHVGKDADLLTGDSIVRDVQAGMREIAGWRSADALTSLASIGVTFGSDGKMSVDAATVKSIPASDLPRAFGLLAAARALGARLSSYSDPATGIIKSAMDGLTETDRRIQAQIGDITDRVNTMQKALQEKLARADALLAQLQGQQNMLDASLKGLNLTLYGKQNA